MLHVSDVILCADSAHAHGRIELAAELLDLAGAMMPDRVHDSANATARLAFMAVADRLPMTTTHHHLEGGNR